MSVNSSVSHTRGSYTSYFTSHMSNTNTLSPASFMFSSDGVPQPSLVDQHGAADFPLDAPDVSGLLRQSSILGEPGFRDLRRDLHKTTHPPWLGEYRGKLITTLSSPLRRRRMMKFLRKKWNLEFRLLCIGMSFFLVTVPMWTLWVDVSETYRDERSLQKNRYVTYTAHSTGESVTGTKSSTIIVLEKVSKTGTTSLRDHFIKYTKVCFHGVNGFKSEQDVRTDREKCPCDTEVLISHLSRFPSYMEHVLGHCNLSTVLVVSIIPVREGRIDSELNYGQRILGLDPEKSVLDNRLGYQFTPYADYAANVLANTTCLFDFITGVPQLPRRNPTRLEPFKCTTKVCAESVQYIKTQEAKQLKLLRQKYPICSESQLAPLRLPSKRQIAEEQENEHYHVGVRTIYTIGQPRTGSTFQQVLLCLLAHLRSRSVSCGADEKNVTLRVVKLHPMHNHVLHLGSSEMLFTTERDAGIWTSTNFSWTGKNASHVQRYQEFVRCPMCQISMYQPIFQLSDKEVLELTQYLRYWSILRQCCGSQLSKWFQGELLGCAGLDYHVEGRLDYHMCGVMNLTAVEEHMIQSSLYSIVPADKLAAPSHLRFLWHKRGDCARSHGDIRDGVGFNLQSISANFCATLHSKLHST